MALVRPAEPRCPPFVYQQDDAPPGHPLRLPAPRKDPWFTLVAVLALGLGIGLNTTVFTFVNAVLIRGLPFDHSEQLLYLNSRSISTGDERSVSFLDFDDWRAQVYQPFRQRSPSDTGVIVRTAGAPATITSMVRQAIQEVDPDQPMFDIRSLDEELLMHQWAYRVFGSMFAIFALIALVLSAVGIYAVTSSGVSQRTSEIGVRMALGAQPRQVSWLILKGGCWQLAIGITLGLLGGWGVTFVMQSLLVQISPTDPVTFAAITAALSMVTLAACLIPARRATKLDPVQALNRS